MTFDLLIRNGTVVDGTGAAKFSGDVGITAGRITESGQFRLRRPPRSHRRARQGVVCPGFIDPHTHYDPQICWDPAPVEFHRPRHHHGGARQLRRRRGAVPPADHDLLRQDLVTVEGMSPEVLKAGITWDWETFPEYMDAAEKRGSGPNLAFLVPLGAGAHSCAGTEGPDRAATADETKKNKQDP